MENLSYHLTSGWPGPKKILALRQRQYHLVWFLPYAVLYVLLYGRRFDCIHIGDPVLAIVARIARTICRRKVAVTVHGLDLTFGSRIYQVYLRLFLTADVYIAISQSTRNIALARGLNPVVIIPVGVDQDVFEVEFKNRSAGPLLTVGRLVPRKGVAWFVREVLPKLDIRYEVVGTGPDENVIRSIAREAGVLDRIQISKNLSEPEKISRYARTRVFVMPNIRVPNDVEGFGIVALEAAAAGLPVVAARLEGIQDAVIDGRNGVLVDPGNSKAFTSAIRRFLDDPAGAEEFGRRAQSFTREHYAWPVIIQKYQAEFARLISPDEYDRLSI